MPESDVAAPGRARSVTHVTQVEGMIAIGGARKAKVAGGTPSVGPRNVFDHARIAMVDTRLVVSALYLLVAATAEMITRQKLPHGVARTEPLVASI